MTRSAVAESAAVAVVADPDAEPVIGVVASRIAERAAEWAVDLHGLALAAVAVPAERSRRCS